MQRGFIVATKEEFEKLVVGKETTKVERINPYSYSIFQPFSVKGQQQVSGRNVWAWDGNREAPSLTPSFLHESPRKEYRIHLYFTKGEIDLLPDSTARFEEAYP